MQIDKLKIQEKSENVKPDMNNEHWTGLSFKVLQEVNMEESESLLIRRLN